MVSFSPELAERICEELSKGKSLRAIERMEGMPTMSGIMKWLAQGDAYKAAGDTENDKALFVEQYARALLIRADTIFEETLDIADDKEADMFFDDNGKQVVNFDHINRARLRVDTRKWMVGKMNPKKYGDKQDITTGGKEIKGGIVVVSQADKDILERI